MQTHITQRRPRTARSLPHHVMAKRLDLGRDSQPLPARYWPPESAGGTLSFAGASWSTTCDGHSGDAAPLELSALAEHLTLCQQLRGRLFSLRCAAQAMNGFAGARFATTLVVVVLLGCAGSLTF